MFKSIFRKCRNLNIPKQAHVYLFYNGLRPEFCNMTDTLEIYDAFNLYEMIVENQANYPTNMKVPKKIVGMHNIDAVRALTAQVEVITKKFGELTQLVIMVQQLASFYAGYVAYHITVSCSLASTYNG